MLLLIFEIGGERYALDAGVVVRVIPRIQCDGIPGTEDFIAGTIIVQGKRIPVIDLCLYHHSVPCRPRLSTRIMIVNHVRKNFKNIHVGLVAEGVTETVRVDDDCLDESTMKIDTSPGLQVKENVSVQWYDLGCLLTEELLDTMIQE